MEYQDQKVLDMLVELMGRVFHGRRVIKASVKAITPDNIVQVMQDAIAIHSMNVADIRFLDRYYRGIQPILLRHKKIRPEICNKVVENHAYEAVQFKLSYEFSYPVQYVTRGESDKAGQISNLDGFMRSENKYTDDGEIAQWMYICGQGYRFCLPDEKPDEAPFRIASLDPDSAFVIYSGGPFREPMAGVVITTNANNETVYTIYTPDMCYTYIDGVITSKPITLGYVPVIEYPLNPERMGAFEPVIPLLNGINILNSNGLDGVDQIIQAIIAFINCEVGQDDLDSAAKNGAICVKGVPGLPADVKSIAEKISQTELDAKADRFYRIALTIMGIPDRAAQSSGGDTGEAVQLRNGWSVAEARALITERFWNASENRFLKLALRICKDLAPDKITDLDISDMDIKFTRNLSENLLVKTQGLNNLKTAGVNKEMAIQAVGLFSDPHAVAQTSDEWENAANKATLTIALKDLPISGRIQAAAQLGIALTEKDFETQTTLQGSAQGEPQKPQAVMP